MTSTELRNSAATRVREAKVLLTNGYYDGAMYLAGYAVEFTLKARICDTLNWSEYPPPIKEITQLLKIHTPGTLLLLTGREADIKANYFEEWSKVKTWTPEMRYDPVGRTSRESAEAFLQAVDVLLQQL